MSSFSPALGFSTTAVKGCAPAGVCAAFPLVHVNICMAVNSVSQFCIEEGCSFPGVTLNPDCALTVSYQPPITENSWGSVLRQFQFSRDFQPNRFLRITVCAASTCADACATVTQADGSGAFNSLTAFTVDGRSIMTGIRGLIAESNACCSFTSTSCADISVQHPLDNLLPGNQLVIGPLGDLPF